MGMPMRHLLVYRGTVVNSMCIQCVLTYLAPRYLVVMKITSTIGKIAWRFYKSPMWSLYFCAQPHRYTWSVRMHSVDLRTWLDAYGVNILSTIFLFFFHFLLSMENFTETFCFYKARLNRRYGHLTKCIQDSVRSQKIHTKCKTNINLKQNSLTLSVSIINSMTQWH